MKPLRIGFDLDGVVADFASAFRDVETRLFGPASHLRAPEPDAVDAPGHGEPAPRRLSARDARRRQDEVWRAIEETADFWETLQPLDASAVRRIQELSLTHGWEVFFITQRPPTTGDTVQRQSQRWLARHGYELPSVLVLGGSRGAAAAALRLDYHVDDSARHCLDIVADARATRALLIVPEQDAMSVESARRLGVGTVASIAAALDILDQASLARSEPGLLARLADLVGWSRRG